MKLSLNWVAQVSIRRCLILGVIAIVAFISKAAAERVPSSNSPPQPAPTSTTQTVDDADPGWIWHGMEDYSDPDLHGASGHAGGSGSYGAYTFAGVGVDIYGLSAPATEVNGRIHKLGSVQVTIDGKPSSSVVEKGTATSYGFLIARIDGLSNGNHVLQIGPDSGWGVVDYIVVHKTVSAADAAAMLEAANRPLIPAGYYRLIPQSAPDKYLEVSDPSCPDGAIVQIYKDTPTHQQVWHIVPLGGERYRLSPSNAPDEAISVPNLTPELDDPQVVIWKYTGDPRQQMSITPADNGFVRIGPITNPNEVLNVFFNMTSDGTKIIGYQWLAGSKNEVWWLERVSTNR